MWDKYYHEVCRLMNIAHEMKREVNYCIRHAADYQLEAMTAMTMFDTVEAKRELEFARMWSKLADSINTNLHDTIVPRVNRAIELAKFAI